MPIAGSSLGTLNYHDVCYKVRAASLLLVLRRKHASEWQVPVFQCLALQGQTELC